MKQYEDYEALLGRLEIGLDTSVRTHIVKAYRDALKAADGECNKLE